MEAGKVIKSGEELFFFFFCFFVFVFVFVFVFFFLLFTFENDEICFGSTKMGFSTGKKHFTPGKTIRKNDFAPSEKYACYAPVKQGL